MRTQTCSCPAITTVPASAHRSCWTTTACAAASFEWQNSEWASSCLLLYRRVQADTQREQHAKDKQQHDQELLRKTVSCWAVRICFATGRNTTVVCVTTVLSLHPGMQAQEQEAQHKQEEAVAARTAAIQGLSNMVADPVDLWQAAVQLAKSYTSAAGGAVCRHHHRLHLCSCCGHERTRQSWPMVTAQQHSVMIPDQTGR